MATDRRVLRSPVGGALTIQQLGQKALLDDSGATGPIQGFVNPILGNRPNIAQQPTEGGVTPQINPANIAKDFQWTGEWDAANRGLQQQESDAGLNRTNSLASIAEQYAIAMRKAEEQGAKGKKSLFARLADKGALGSGMALEDIAEYDTSYNDYLGDISRSRASDLAGVETGYASKLNALGREREMLAARQQTAEQARLKEEARLQAEAARQQAETEARRVQLADMAAAQQAAQAAMQQAMQQAAAQAASVSYNAPSFPTGFYGGGGGGGDYGGGGGYSEAPAPQAPAAEPTITLPPFGQGAGNAPISWVKQNIDPSMDNREAQMIVNALAQAGGNGLTRTQLGQIIQNARMAAGGNMGAL